MENEVNKQRMLQLADVIEKSTRFNMYNFYEKDGKDYISSAGVIAITGNFCNTTCCIAGEAALLGGDSYDNAYTAARHYLDLTDEKAKFLFFGHWSPEELAETDNQLAARVIRAMVKHDGIPPSTSYVD